MKSYTSASLSWFWKVFLDDFLSRLLLFLGGVCRDCQKCLLCPSFSTLSLQSHYWGKKQLSCYLLSAGAQIMNFHIVFWRERGPQTSTLYSVSPCAMNLNMVSWGSIYHVHQCSIGHGYHDSPQGQHRPLTSTWSLLTTWTMNINMASTW